MPIADPYYGNTNCPSDDAGVKGARHSRAGGRLPQVHARQLGHPQMIMAASTVTRTVSSRVLRREPVAAWVAGGVVVVDMVVLLT